MTNLTTQTNREEYISAIRSCHKPSMVSYYDKNAVCIIKLDDGLLLPIPKCHIQTTFYFGESGYDYDEVIKSAQAARQSEEFFIQSNLENIDEALKNIRDEQTHVVLIATTYDNDKIAYPTISRYSDYVTNPCFYKGMREATKTEREAYAQGLEFAKADLLKRLKAYLKRYGMSKVHVHTYWIDA